MSADAFLVHTVERVTRTIDQMSQDVIELRRIRVAMRKLIAVAERKGGWTGKQERKWDALAERYRILR